MAPKNKPALPKRGLFELVSAPFGPNAEGYAFATDGKITVYIPAALTKDAKLTGKNIGQQVELGYLPVPGKRFSAFEVKLVPKGAAPVRDTAAVEAALARLEDALDDVYAVLGIAAED